MKRGGGGSHTSSWIYLERLSFIYLFIFNICSYGDTRKRERDGGRPIEEEKKRVGVTEIKQVRDYGKLKGNDPDPVCPN